ncbi:MAG: hypothetical protein ACLR8Y_06770 [Alistipes indistinctus]
MEPAQPVIDYLTLIRKGISPDLLPSNTHIYWKPDNFSTNTVTCWAEAHLSSRFCC